MQTLTKLAHDMGITIEYKRVRGRDGEYRRDLNRIRLRPGMTERLERSVLAHELAHAIFGDAPSPFGPINAKQERRADEWAALHLITPDAYADAERHHGGHTGGMAIELGVIVDIVEAYRRVLLRSGDTVYVDPRMGAGQWHHAEEVRA